MLHAVDSFVEYLASELEDVISVRLVRVSANDPQSARLQHGYLNVSVLGFDTMVNDATALVSVDLLASDERQALTILASVTRVLTQSFYTPALDYSQETPTATGYLVSWIKSDVKFEVVKADDSAFHMSATMQLRYVPQSA